MASRVVCLVVLGTALASAASACAAAGPALSVDAGSGNHAISPLIYGWNFANPSFAAEIQLPVDRRGGNRADTLNWQTGFENTSLDYFFEDLPWCWGSDPCSALVDPAQAYTDQIEADRTVQAKTILDLPLMGWVAGGSGHFDHPFVCSYTTGNVDPYQSSCGDNRNADMTAFLSNDDRTGVSAVAPGAGYPGDWIADLITRYNDAAHGGVAFYELGNEPGLWDSTHHDWHPNPTSASELLDDSEALAGKVKAADPSADVIGPAEWGWTNYFCSAKDGGCGPDGPNTVAGSDWESVGSMPLMEAYLKRFKTWADAHAGQRLLDYLDVHYYAQGGDTPEITRSLWDPTYLEPSWIGSQGMQDYIFLISRLHEWVANGYPGTKISLSEYDLARASDATTNNIIEADVLGIFAREQLDMATLWPEVSNDNYYDAFRIYRNYDGAHSKFGDTYVSSTSANQSQVAVYGARRSGDGALTVVLINKADGELTSPVSLAGFTSGPAAQVWRWTTPGGGIARQADQSVCGGSFQLTLAAKSITMLVVPAGDGTCPTATVGGGTTPTGGTSPSPDGTTQTPTSSAPVRCRVPKLIGLTLKKAKRRLAKAHCRFGKVRRARSRRRRGTVIAQKPQPGKVLVRDARVSVVVSRGR